MLRCRAVKRRLHRRAERGGAHAGPSQSVIIFEDGKAASTSGQLYGWAPLDASHGTTDDPGFLRVQIQNNDQICSFGRKLTEDSKDTWNSCTTRDKPDGGKVTRPAGRLTMEVALS